MAVTPLKINIFKTWERFVAACGDDRNDPPYLFARSLLPGRALVPRSQFVVQMKPAVQVEANCRSKSAPFFRVGPPAPGYFTARFELLLLTHNGGCNVGTPAISVRFQ